MSLTINGVTTTKFSLKSGEAKTLVFTYSVDISDAEFFLVCKDVSDSTIFSKEDSDFNKTYINDNKVSVILTSTDLDLDSGNYYIELRAVWNTLTSVDKTETLKLKIDRALT